MWLRSQRQRRAVSERNVIIEPDWERFADGRPWRLKQGRDFQGAVRTVEVAARTVALRRGQVVRIAKDGLAPDKAVWVQFADAEVARGSPCPCGSTALRRVHTHFTRCEMCGAQLILTPSLGQTAQSFADGEQGGDGQGPALYDDKHLRAYTGVRLALWDMLPEWHRYWGYGFDASGELVLMYLLVPLAHGEPVPDESSPTGYAHKVVRWITGPYGDLLDTERLRSRLDDEWDIVLP